MAWLVLIASGCMEAVWAIALDKTQGFTQVLPTVVFLAAMVLSMLGLGYAVKSLPIGTSYAVWTGIGASITVIYSMATGAESATAIKIVLLIGLVGCIIGLRLVGENG